MAMTIDEQGDELARWTAAVSDEINAGGMSGPQIFRHCKERALDLPPNLREVALQMISFVWTHKPANSVHVEAHDNSVIQGVDVKQEGNGRDAAGEGRTHVIKARGAGTRVDKYSARGESSEVEADDGAVVSDVAIGDVATNTRDESRRPEAKTQKPDETEGPESEQRSSQWVKVLGALLVVVATGYIAYRFGARSRCTEGDVKTCPVVGTDDGIMSCEAGDWTPCRLRAPASAGAR